MRALVRRTSPPHCTNAHLLWESALDSTRITHRTPCRLTHTKHTYQQSPSPSPPHPRYHTVTNPPTCKTPPLLFHQSSLFLLRSAACCVRVLAPPKAAPRVRFGSGTLNLAHKPFTRLTFRGFVVLCVVCVCVFGAASTRGAVVWS